MRIRYSRGHVRESVALAATVSALFGIWVGARVASAGMLEIGGVLALTFVAQMIGFSRIDKRYSGPAE